MSAVILTDLASGSSISRGVIISVIKIVHHYFDGIRIVAWEDNHLLITFLGEELAHILYI